MPEFLDIVKQFQREERTNIQVDTQGRLVLSPELEQFLRTIVQDEVSKAMDGVTRRLHGGLADMETK